MKDFIYEFLMISSAGTTAVTVNNYLSTHDNFWAGVAVFTGLSFAIVAVTMIVDGLHLVVKAVREQKQ